MKKIFEFKNNTWIAFLIPWIFFPFFLDFNIIAGIMFLFFAITLLYILNSKKIVFYNDYILIKKYKWIFEKNTIVNFDELSFVYFTIITHSATYNSTITIQINDGKKEKVDFSNSEFKQIRDFLVNKGIKIKTNNNDYK